jgi:pimeloyl-ACP methyl ester carboxylesterase
MSLGIEVQADPTEKRSGYAPINGLNIYFEVQGLGKPLVYIPAVFGHAGVTELATLSRGRALITVDLQGHGRTADIDRPLSFEQHADDVVALLRHLRIDKADLFGESFGGIAAMLIALRNPEFVNRLATYGAIFGKPQEAYKAEALATQGTLTSESEAFAFQRENYKRVAPDPSYWPVIWAKVLRTPFAGFSRSELAALEMPVLIAVGDHDFVRIEHAVETFQTIPNAELAVIPDAGHFVLNAEQHKLLPVIEAFLDRPITKKPFATTKTGYRPGFTR